jgi:hypothetical protein
LIALILFIFYLALIFWCFGRLPMFRHSGLSSKGLAILFSIKLLFSIILVLVYTYYYTDRGMADIYKYYDDGNAIYSSACTHPRAAIKVITGIGFNANDAEIRAVLAPTHHFDKKGDSFLESNHHLIIRLHAIFRFFSYGSIYIHSLFFCFLSFIGLVALYRALKQFFEGHTGQALIIPLFFIPSILFWSSGLLKETLVIFFLGLLLFTCMKLAAMKNIFVNLLLSLICLQFLYLSKPFIALSFLISLYVMGTFYFKGYIRIISILAATMVVLWFLYAHNAFICDIMASLINKRNDFVALGLKMKAGSLVDTQIRGGGCLEPLALIPSGFYHLFLQPFIWSGGLFEKLFGMENLLIILFTLFTLFNFKRPKGTKLQLAAFCFTFFILNYILIGITIPIIGALVRYKIFGLLFYIILLICCLDLGKIIFMVNASPVLASWLQKVRKSIFLLKQAGILAGL